MGSRTKLQKHSLAFIVCFGAPSPQVVGGLRSLHVTLKCMTFESPQALVPCLGVGMFISILSGALIIVFIRDCVSEGKDSQSVADPTLLK